MVIELQGYKITLPDPPKNKRDILFWDKPKAEQYWRRPELLSDQDFLALPQDEQDAYAKSEWLKCRDGLWFFNNGVPTYLTGDHYFFLTYWTHKGRFMDFMKPQADDFYFEYMVMRDPKCFGSLKLKPRREGCTQRTLSRMLNSAIHTMGANYGIQSKTSDDAKKVNFATLVLAFRKLPVWKKPVQSGSSDPTKVLRFDKPREQATKTNQKKTDDALYMHTSVDWRATKANAYDGDQLKYFIGDEISKLEEADAYTLWNIIRHTLLMGSGYDLWGKAALLSTIADEDTKSALEAAASFRLLWNDSNPNVRDANGFTKSGLYRYFIPVWTTLRGADPVTGEQYVDKYGNVNEELAKAALLRERQALKNDARALSQLIRKRPFTEKEALAFGGNETIFDKMRINPRLDELQAWLPKDPDADQMTPYTRGNLHWVNNQRYGNVHFVPNINGKFYLKYTPQDLLGDGYTNRLMQIGDKRRPYPATQFVVGVDSFDYANKDGKGYSNGAFLVGFGYNHIDPKKSDKLCMEYCYREADPEVFYDDVLKAAYFYGAKICVESNTPGFIESLRRQRQLAFVMRDTLGHVVKSTARKNDYGTATSTKSTNYQIGLIENRIAAPNTELNPEAVDHLQDIWFDRTLEQARDYTLEEKNKYDLISAWGQCEIGLQAVQKIRHQNVAEDVDPAHSPINTIFPRYDNSGTYAKPITRSRQRV